MSKFDLEVTLREVTKENLRAVLRLKVAPHQEQFVASNAVSLPKRTLSQKLPGSALSMLVMCQLGF